MLPPIAQPAAAWPLLALAGLVAGFVNAIAGGGSLLSFPALIAAGLPPLVANVTNTVALCSGYLGASLAQRRQLRGQRQRLAVLLPIAALGGLVGGLLLLAGDARLFERLVPWLILSGALLLALQEPLLAWQRRRTRAQDSARGELATPIRAAAAEAQEHPSGIAPHDGLAAATPTGPRRSGPVGQGAAGAAPLVFLAAVYGGYFGAGLSVIVLAVLAISLDDNLVRLNGLKQAIALVTNLLAALLFVLAAPLHWPAALLLALTSLAGGALGGRLAAVIPPQRLRAVVVMIALLVAAAYVRR